MDTLDAMFVAEQLGHAMSGVADEKLARVIAENMSFRFHTRVKSEAFVQACMQIYKGVHQASDRYVF
jgi:hypothetical protein